MIPVAELSERLGGSQSDWPRLGLPIVVVEANKRLLALVVEAVLGVHKVVIREMQGLPRRRSICERGCALRRWSSSACY